jgi:ADP-ribose pyrophosphatase YjhB (NUDIX family)
VPSYYHDPAAPTPNVPRRIGVAAVIERAGAFLVERRADDDAGGWAFLGGGLREDESVVDALHREVREETGFAIAEAELLGVFSDPTRVISYPGGNVCRLLSVAFRVHPVGDDEPVLSDESAEMRFVTRAELEALPVWPVHQPLRDAVLSSPPGPVVQ